MTKLDRDEILRRLSLYLGEEMNLDTLTASAGIIEILQDLSQNDREKAIGSIKEFFCIHCGTPNHRCQCWNDE